MLRRGVNCPMSSSVGRLIDGVAALVLNIEAISYEGEAAVRFEAVAESDDPGGYQIANAEEGGLIRGDWRPLVRAVVEDCLAGVPAATIAGRAHAALAEWAAGLIRQFPGRAAVLGGGCFQNRLLTEGVGKMPGVGVFAPASIPPGDGGLAVGQLAVALLRRDHAR
jgi:hydrogenase maturation protein HypF